MMAFPLLTFSVVSGNTGLPLINRGVASAFSAFNSQGKILSAYSAVEVAAIWGGLLSHIRQGVTSSIREDWRLRLSRGAFTLPFFYSLNQSRFPMFRYLLSSRFLRFRLRLMSQFSNLVGHTAATVALGALLVLPVLYFGEVL